jgi:hypothetical protein
MLQRSNCCGRRGPLTATPKESIAGRQNEGLGTSRAAPVGHRTRHMALQPARGTCGQVCFRRCRRIRTVRPETWRARLVATA